jgi:hypothetical protein
VYSGRLRGESLRFQPDWGNLAVRDDRGGRRKRAAVSDRGTGETPIRGRKQQLPDAYQYRACVPPDPHHWEHAGDAREAAKWHRRAADAWLEMSGAKSYEPFLRIERAEFARLNGDDDAARREFREAHRLFLEIGAPIRAAEVARELES